VIHRNTMVAMSGYRRVVRWRRWTVWMLGAMLVGPGCAECDQAPCEEDCDESFPDDDTQRTACYVECAEQADACRRG
jgi:hypothetical protein